MPRAEYLMPASTPQKVLDRFSPDTFDAVDLWSQTIALTKLLEGEARVSAEVLFSLIAPFGN